MRALLLCLLALPLAADTRPEFTCQRTNNNPRALRVRCEAKNVGSAIPAWRLYGASEDMLMEFDEGTSFRFDVPFEWRLLEMRVENDVSRVRVRVWVRNWRGKVQWKRIGDEGSVE